LRARNGQGWLSALAKKRSYSKKCVSMIFLR
jgi:hypothetical protein